MKLLCPAILSLAAAAGELSVDRVRRQDATLYDERKRAMEDCGSHCWKWDDSVKKCVLAVDANGNSDCFNIKCDHDQVTVEFQSKLFRTTNDKVKDLIQPQSIATKLVQHGTDSWKVTCKLGECGMSVKCEELKGPNDTKEELYLVFNTPIMAGNEVPAITWNNKELFLNPLQSLNVDFKCAYKASITVDTDEFTVNAWEIEDKVLHTGSLRDGFKIKMFKDSSTSIPLTGSTLIGTTVFASIDWEISTLRNKVNFFVESCDLDFAPVYKGSDAAEFDFSSTSDGDKFPLIDDTCYSQTFSAAQVGNKKIVNDKAVFGFKTFISGRGAKNMKIQLQCCVKVCVPTGDYSCYSQIKKSDSECPADAALRYSAGKFIAQG